MSSGTFGDRDDVAALLGVGDDTAEGFAEILAQVLAAQGETVTIGQEGAATLVRQQGWRLTRDLDIRDAGARVWNRLWEGMAAAHNRDLSLGFSQNAAGLSWRIG